MCSLRAWQLPFRLLSLHWCQPTPQLILLNLPETLPWAINQHLQEALQWLQQTSSVTSTPVSLHSMPRKKPSSVAPGAPPSTEGAEDPLRQKAIPPPVATFTQTPHGWPHHDIPILAHTIPQLLQLALPWTPEMEGISFISQHQTPPRVGPAGLTDKPPSTRENKHGPRVVTSYQGHCDSCNKELELNVELMMHLNEVQAIEAIKEAEVCHTTTACILQQIHRENMLKLEHEVKAEERWDCQVFMEALGWPYEPVHPKLKGH